ncbi:MAG: acyltransferase [Phycisphaerae bacterium]|nr:acyltransferase [Gemmatimonadaceae bacterium]
MSPSRTAFRTDLEGLRGAAMLLVVLFHAGLSAAAGGFVGVDVFFVLSGFFITGLLVRDTQQSGSVNLPEFYATRALRLLPTLLVVLLVTLVVVMSLYAPIDRAAIAGNARAVAMHSGNMAFANESVDYFSAGENPLLHTWSLAVEQQFYFFWPMLFVFVALVFDRSARGTSAFERPSIRKPLCIAMATAGVLSFVASMLLTRAAQPWAFFSMPTRVWEFALGGMLTLCLSPSNTAVLSSLSVCGRELLSTPEGVHRLGATLQGFALLALGIAVAMYDRATPYPGVAALLPVSAAIAMIAGGHYAPQSLVSRALTVPPLQWLGRHSYAWYLWHWPLIGLAGVLHPHVGVVGKLAWCIVALVLSWMTYTFVERPARTGRLAAVPASRLTMISFGATVGVAVIAQASMVMARRTANEPQQRPFAAARTDRIDHGCWATTVEELNSACVFGDTTSSTTVVLFGDSHAEHWFGALDKAGRDRGWKIVLMVKGGCPVADMPELMHARLKRYYHECTRFREAMVQRIIALKPAAAVLSSWDHYLPNGEAPSSWQVTPEMWQGGLRRTYARLSAAGVPIVAVRGTPRTKFNVPSCLSRKTAALLFAGTCEYKLGASLSTVAIAAQSSAARGLGVQFVDMNDVVCQTSPCSTFKNGVVIFTDDNHLTVAFSRSVAEAFGARVAKAAGVLGQTLP